MARSGMAALIQELRLNASAFEGDETVNGIQYWTDDQLQAILDQFSADLNNVELIKFSQQESGITVYKVYYLPPTVSKNLEGAATVGAFTVVDSLGNTITGYTFDAARRRFDFTINQGGKTYFLRAREFDMNSATADVWYKKAGLRAELIDWKAGTYNLKEDQVWQHCMEMYYKWSGRNSFKRVQLNRIDYANS